MEVRHAKLQEERELLEAAPIDDLYTAPTQAIAGNSALVTAAGEQRGRLPTWPRPHDIDTETFHVPLCSTDEDDRYGLDFDEHGQCAGLCFTADMSRVCLPEQQRSILDFDRVTIMQ
eukprot:3791346-Pyramimonas_sp.AAC.1